MLKTKITLAAAAAAVLFGSVPTMAQPTWRNDDTSWRDRNGNWDRETFWRGAPSDLYQRINFVQQRIDRGVRDGSLTRSEARNLNMRLRSIKRDARRGYLSPSRRDNLQARLDDLSREVRWQRRDGDDRYGDRGRGYGTDRYYNRDDRFSTEYDASRYYRDDARYRERRLNYDDEVYRGSDGRYYCKRDDGTTGLIIGAIGGGVLGNVVDGGDNRLGGTLIGGALGALLGKTIDQSQSDVRCR